MKPKFRAWDKTRKRWIGNNSSHILALYEAYPDAIDLMQYTGRKDKKGKDSCQGDIVDPFSDSGSKGTLLFEVVWDDELAAFRYKRLDGGGATAFIFSACIGEDEVVGNVKDNPELLEKSVKSVKSVAKGVNDVNKAQ